MTRFARARQFVTVARITQHVDRRFRGAAHPGEKLFGLFDWHTEVIF